jgi:hypothetical protein
MIIDHTLGWCGIGCGIEEALLPSVRARLIAGGKARVESFDWSWHRYAREFVSLVDNVLGLHEQ